MIFTPEHVQLIAEGRKTQTRRVCKQGEELRYMLWYNPHRLKGAEYLHGSYQRAVVYTASGRIKWLLEQEYAVQPGRTLPGAWLDAGGKLLLNPRGIYERRHERPADVQAMLDLGWQPLRIRITDIRQERLQDISEDDARAEGYQPAPTVIAGLVPGMPLAWYEQVWRRINTRKGTRWADNPLVWVLTFEAVR